MTEENTGSGTTEQTQTSTDGGQQQPKIEDLLATLSEDNRKIVLNQLSTARNDAAGYRTRLREAETKATEYDKIVESQKTAEQKLTDRATAAEQQLQTLRLDRVKDRIEVLAANRFAYPADAKLYLEDLPGYIGRDGTIDETAIRADLDRILEARPNLSNQSQQRQGPRPDTTQGNSSATAQVDPVSSFSAWLGQKLN